MRNLRNINRTNWKGFGFGSETFFNNNVLKIYPKMYLDNGKGAVTLWFE